jgi:hypothetical protein
MRTVDERAYCTIWGGEGVSTDSPGSGRAGVVDMNRIVGFLVLALVIYFIITEPKTAAGVVHSLAATLRYAADSITTFFRAVV